MFDDSGNDVKSYMKYPEHWFFVGQRGWDRGRDASPDIGIQFSFSKDGTETVSIAAMRFFELSFSEKNDKAKAFTMDGGLHDVTYLDSDAERTSAFYVFAKEMDELPQYFVSVNV